MYGTRIRELRKARGMTMKQLGQRLSLAESTISGYENEIRKPDMDTLLQFADLFEVTVDYLLGRTEQPPAPVSEVRESVVPYNYAILEGEMETLTEDEAKHVKNSLEMFRLWKAKKSAEPE
ncbi:helix-turn-helix domain-containing protein [Paenibacillus alkalitolerans]|uniref:helix-turn-helix domain-containing protein n=1 Tax=Paenibacillus alkalitolerans TaxID=2799335 RepID=UPI0018F2EF19|nr:helix-turn-helix domain-containing protein [Paenibacillus alkalitolerans]